MTPSCRCLSWGVLLALFLLPPDAAAGPSSGFALRFFGHGTGDIDRVKIPIDPQVPADVGGDFTLEWWMKANASDNATAACSGGGDNWITGNIIFDRDVFFQGDFGDYGISIRGGIIAFGIDVQGSSAGICGSTSVADGVWHHVAVTRNGSTGQLRIFVDGAPDGAGPGPSGDVSYRDGRGTSFANDPFLVIGAEKHDVDAVDFPAYDGLVDEVRLSGVIRYDSAFDPAAVAFTPDADTLVLYHFDAGPEGPCTGAVADGSGAAGGPSSGTCRFGGSAPAGPLYVADTPFGAAVTTSTTTTTLPQRTCGNPVGPLSIVQGAPVPLITATDALFVLQVVVGAESCLACICDIDGSGDVVTTDVLRLLRITVGAAFDLDCPSC